VCVCVCVCECLEDIESHLAVHWGLYFKPSSLSVLVCRGSIDMPINICKWPVHNTMNVLGHLIQNDGGIRDDWLHTEAKMWASFWANAGSKRAKQLRPAQKAMLIYRTVLACVLWKVSRWPWQKTIALELDSIQCRMLVFILPCVRSYTEDIDTFCRRQARQARNVANKCGLWSIVWARRVIAWNAHIRRGEMYAHPVPRLLDHHNSVWLMHQRGHFVSQRSFRNSVFAGRTGTRLNIGRPQVRWSDGLSVAASVSEGRSETQRGANSLSIAARIREALSALRQPVAPSQSG
jgi:hypothetical protein